jgi:hypothetical protein
MEKKYHYATVSKALEELKEKVTYDFNLHEDDIKISHRCTHYDRRRFKSDDETVVYGIQNLEKMVFLTGFQQGG